LLLAALPASAFGASIGNSNNYQSARVLDKGQVSIGFGTGFLHLEEVEEEGGYYYENIYFVPDAWAHYGITDGVQIGVRAAPIVAGIDIKTRIFSNDKTSLAFAPYIGFSYEDYGSGGDYSSRMFGLTTALSLILGVKAGEGYEVTFSPKLLYDINFTHEEESIYDGGKESYNGYSEILSIGGSIGFIFGAGDLSVIPELGVYHTLSQSKSNGDSSHSEGTVVFPGIGISIVF